MKLLTFSDERGRRIGVLDRKGKSIVDLSIIAPSLPIDMLSFIEAGETGLAIARKALAEGHGTLPLSAITVHAPVPRPRRNILCVGNNYRAHAEEVRVHRSRIDTDPGNEMFPEFPIVFTKSSGSVIGPGDPIPAHLDPTNSVDYEGELAVVIGRPGRTIKKAEAWDFIYGYTIVNDVTARTLQTRHKQWFLGKSVDGFCPMGPCLVTKDEIDDIRRLHLETRVNGELRQQATVSQLIFDIPTLIETLSQSMTLEAGDLIATGTCAGVGISFSPPRFMKAGDVVAVTIEPIGTLENPVQ
jgi:2-keto-4-pentenoate hydratase/2-oxohepta-3-ene-1,7-dioic acid hydratase in catechol pathway